MTKRELATLAIRLLGIYSAVQAIVLAERFFMDNVLGSGSSGWFEFPGQNWFVILMLPVTAFLLWISAERLAEHIFPEAESEPLPPAFGNWDLAAITLAIVGLWFVIDATAHFAEIIFRIWITYRSDPSLLASSRLGMDAFVYAPSLLKLAVGLWFILKPQAAIQWFKSRQITEHNQ